MADDRTVTVEDLTKAITNSPKNKGLREEAARDIARHVLNFFGYSDRIIDNVLEPEDRDAFYMLEDATILTTEREETTLYDGREWRINYWLFRKDKIRELMNSEGNVQEDNSNKTIYDDLDEDMWRRD